MRYGRGETQSGSAVHAVPITPRGSRRALCGVIVTGWLASTQSFDPASFRACQRCAAKARRDEERLHS